jgi:hypothetical protein
MIVFLSVNTVSSILVIPLLARSSRDLCGQHISRRPYGELGSVDRGNCLCCVSIVSSFGEISPGCGCEREIVDEIVTELKQRMRRRGDTAQIQRAEQMLQRLDVVESKLVRYNDVRMKKCRGGNRLSFLTTSAHCELPCCRI